MKLFINRDNSASDVCFVIYDELGRQKYFAILKRSKHSVSRNSIKIDITDTHGCIVAVIRQITTVGVNTFNLKASDKSATKLVMIKDRMDIRCRYYGKNWHICGNIADKNFSIIDVDNTVLAFQNKNKGTYELEILNLSDELICLETAICINMINTVDKLAIPAV